MAKTPTPEPCGARLRRREWLAAVLASLAGCGGGVESGGTGTGSQGTLAVGTISGFGSIVVNGVHYDESAAAVADDDGRVLRPSDLRLGMRATVLAAPAAAGGIAVASTVTVQRELGGPIDALDAGAGRLVVLGQAVELLPTTVIEGGLAALAVGGEVAVHATLDVARRVYVATRVEPLAADAAFKIRGVVDTLDLAGGTLTIGTLRVDWRAVAPERPSDLLAPGRRVRLLLARTPAGGTRTATALSAAQPMLEDRDEAELEGRITAFVSALSFELEGVQVDASAASFPAGQAGLGVGVRVEVEGRLNGGVLVARQVSQEAEHEDPEPFELSGRIDSVAPETQTFVVRGVTVHWSTATRFEGGTAAQLQVDREVEVRGALNAAGDRIEASSIHVET